MDKKDINAISFKVDVASARQRIDKFLSNNLEEKSRSYIQKLIKQAKVKVNNQSINKNYRLSAGDKVIVESLIFKNLSVKPQKIRLNVVYEDEYFLVISKKAAVVVHPSPGHSENTLVNAVLYYCDSLSSTGGDLRPGIVHRLDKDTSGLIVIAKNDNIHRQLSNQFKTRKVKKTYIALVWGIFSEKKGEIRLPIGRSRLDRRKMSVSLDRGKDAVTEFEVIEKFRKCSLVNVNLKTGRTHQIRVHFSYIGHPIIGDRKYGTRESNNLALEIGLNRQFLHSKEITFIHPVLNEKIEIEDKIAEDLKASLEKLRRIEKMMK